MTNGREIISGKSVVLEIGMVDVDLLNNGSRHPNLAQMKMSGFCKDRKHNVRLLYKQEDLNNLKKFNIIIASKVFNFNKDPKEIQDLKRKIDPRDLISLSNVSDETKVD